MLDIETLRVVLASITLVVFLLVRFGSYHHTRSPYAHGWSWVLLLSAASSVAYLFLGTSVDAVAAPLGNALSIVSVGLIWATGRSLRNARVHAWVIVVIAVAVTVASLLDQRTDGLLPGTAALLAGMAFMFTLASREVWALVLEPHLQHSEAAVKRARPALRAMLGAATGIAVFYCARLIAYFAVGPSSAFYEAWAGTTTTTLLILVLLVVVTFSITELSRFEMTTAWQVRASRDDLTELLTRRAFEERYLQNTSKPKRGPHPSILVIADVDDFKGVNDTLGHDEGDRVLRGFADALRDCLGDADVACRWGGDEFVILLSDSELSEATRTLLRVNEAFAIHGGEGRAVPTVSYGVSHVGCGQPLADALALADDALRDAKLKGRSRIEISEATPSILPG